ncbi:hypothetical protein Prudu_009555 [Prunus dulcis]|uniref:Uncharacterized protein n=1 Tax=Prunus dulcis TaxID=3755 RepID=A0A4Y1R6F4_PRUDU|nr:hypothetical protein Prudu_009555 [Prunus dulcis]
MKQLSGCETASVTCESHSDYQYSLGGEEEERRKLSADLNQMADSSNGKLEETLKVQPDDEVKVVESVTDIAIDDYSAAGKKTHDGDDSSSSSSSSDEETEAGEKSTKVADSGEVEETKEVSVVVVETVESLSNHLDQGVVDDLEAVKEEEEKVLASVDGTNESSPAITDLVSEQIEEKTLTYLDESNGVSLAETDLVSKEVEEPALPSLSEHDEPAPVITDVEEKSEVVDVVSKRIEETIGESSSENVVDGSSKPSPDQVPPPLESADAGEEYGKPVIPESTGNPVINLLYLSLDAPCNQLHGRVAVDFSKFCIDPIDNSRDKAKRYGAAETRDEGCRD